MIKSYDFSSFFFFFLTLVNLLIGRGGGNRRSSSKERKKNAHFFSFLGIDAIRYEYKRSADCFSRDGPQEPLQIEWRQLHTLDTFGDIPGILSPCSWFSFISCFLFILFLKYEKRGKKLDCCLYMCEGERRRRIDRREIRERGGGHKTKRRKRGDFEEGGFFFQNPPPHNQMLFYITM